MGVAAASGLPERGEGPFPRGGPFPGAPHHRKTQTEGTISSTSFLPAVTPKFLFLSFRLFSFFKLQNGPFWPMRGFGPFPHNTQQCQLYSQVAPCQ